MDALIRAIERELANPKHLHRSHGTRSAYNSGCRGPLCRKANRDYGRSRLDSAKPRGPLDGGERDAIIDAYIASSQAASILSA